MPEEAPKIKTRSAPGGTAAGGRPEIALLCKIIEDYPEWNKDAQSDGSGGTEGIDYAHCRCRS